MGALLDSTYLVAAERRGLTSKEVLQKLLRTFPGEDLAISVVSIMELAHGETRADTQARADLRRQFLADITSVLDVFPLTCSIALRAGRLDGLLTKQGVLVAFPDLVIGATALELDYKLVTRNPRHFSRIPGLEVVVHTVL